MMRALFRQRGSQFSVDIVASPDAVAFISEHAAALDSSFSQVPMSDAMRRRLSRSNFIFSGMKTFHELHEAFPSLVDENGVRKPFERFLNDVRSIDKTYNANYLRAEYNFVSASADMAAKWERFSRDGDRYNLQYRTAGDGRVRPEHAALDGVTLPPSDSFWQEFYPPNGWNCFVGSTPVLTAAGWMFIKDVKPGDLVVGGSGEYRAVVAVHAREVDAELVCVRAKGAFAACTENHRLLTSRGWLAAGALMPSDILVQVGKVSALGIFFNAVGNAVTLGKYCLVLLKRKWKTAPPEAVDGDIQGRNVEVGNVTAEQPASLERQPQCREVEADNALGFALGLADGTQPFGMPSARFKRIGQCLGSDFGAVKGCRCFKFLRNLPYKGAVRFVLALPDVLARLCKSVVNGCKVGSRLSAASGIVFPLRPDCLAAVPDGDAAMSEEAADGSSVDTPVQGQPSETALLDKVPRFGGIDNPATLDGFNSFYGFLRRTFFHTRYALVDHKGTTKKSKTMVYNLSVDKDESYVVPTGIAHNCRCNVVQVRKSKYPVTPHDEAMRRGNEALAKDTRGIFRFNPGCEQKSVPDYNPYTIRRCRDCDVAKGKVKFAKFVPENEVCAACLIIHRLRNEGEQRKLTSEERKSIQESAVIWADKHLPKVKMPDGTIGARLTIQTKEGVELHIGKKFFTETYSKCKNSKRVAETMELATRINEWIRDAEQIRVEPGRHHAFDFVVFKAVYNNQDIEFKAKSTEGLIVYMMRLI